MTRRICVFTGSRADYGPLVALMRRLADDPEVDLRVLVSGGHLAAGQGNTVDRVRADGFRVDEVVEMVLATDTAAGVAKSFGLGVIGYADALARIEPDVLVVLGDRYEALAVGVAAMLRSLPIAHIAGGQVTAGSLDDSVRHALTKLAHVHFTSTESFARRILQLGEDPERVHVVGALGLDTIVTGRLYTKRDLLERLEMGPSDLLFAVTFHPATAEPDQGRDDAIGMLGALAEFPDAAVVFTGTNVDRAGGRTARLLADFVDGCGPRARLVPSLGHLAYLSLVKHADVVIGNSSSGLIEAPALGTPTVNIGTRQDGRPRAASVLDCSGPAPQITRTIRRALSRDHRVIAASGRSPYGDGRAAPRIVEVLKSVPLDGLAKKTFIDVVP